MKIFLDDVREEIDNSLAGDCYDMVLNEMSCIAENCTGKIRYYSSQSRNAITGLCTKCNRAIILKSTKH